MSLKDLGVEVGGMSLDGSDCNANERTNNEEILNLVVMQQSLPVANSKGRSCEGLSESSYSTSEPSGTWGDFEGFKESLDRSERFSHNLDVLVKSTKASRVDTELSSGHSSTSAGHLCSEPSAQTGMQEASSSLTESSDNSVTSSRPVWITPVAVFRPPNLLLMEEDLHTRANHIYEDIFKLGFPEVFVSQSRERIRGLNEVFDTDNEDIGIPELTKNQLCIDSGNIWRTLRGFDNTPSLRHPWSKSHCQENLLSVLGIDANQKIILSVFARLEGEYVLNRIKTKLTVLKDLTKKCLCLISCFEKIKDFSEIHDDIFEESNVKDNEDFRFDGFSINDCKALIQTKLSVSPDSRHGHLFTCNLFLKTTLSNGNMQCITIPRKKHIFTTRNLKMKFFGSDVS